MVNKAILKNKGFKCDNTYNKLYYERKDIEDLNRLGNRNVNNYTERKVILKYKPNDSYRCEFLKDGKRIGKVHYNAIEFLYEDYKKPVLCLLIQGGLYIEIGSNLMSIHKFEPFISDSHYLFSIPSFDTVSFYIELTMDIKIKELRKILIHNL